MSTGESVVSAVQAALSEDSHDHSMFRAACSLAFFCFLRVSEFTCSGSFDPLVHLSISDVSFDTSGCLYLFIKTSKTDSFRRGVSLSIGASGKRICAVSAVRRYLQVRGMFVFVLSDDGSPLTPVVVYCWFRAMLSNFGIRGTYSSHSFRIGAATTEVSAGIPDHLIKTLG
ncbi:Retrovirus-related Pol poly from transposon 412, partial [Paramuricea clavata]